MSVQDKLNEIGKLTNSIEPTPYIVSLTRIYTSYLPFLRILELPVPSPEYMFQVFTIEEVEVLLVLLYETFKNAGIENLFILIPYEVILVKDAIEMAAFTGRTAFEIFIKDFVSSDMIYQKGGSKKNRTLFDTIFNSQGGMVGGNNQNQLSTQGRTQGQSVGNAVTTYYSGENLTTTVQHIQNVSSFGAGVGSALSTQQSTGLTLPIQDLISIQTINTERTGRIAKFLKEKDLVVVGLQRLKKQLAAGGDLSTLKKQFNEASARIVEHAQQRFVSQSKETRRTTTSFDFEDAKVDLQRFKESSNEEFGIGFNKNGALLLACALSITGGACIAWREYTHLFNMNSKGTYPENVQFELNAKGKFQLKADVTALWDPETVKARPQLNSDVLSKKEAALRAAGRASEIGKRLEKPEPPTNRKVEVPCGWKAGQLKPCLYATETFEKPSQKNMSNYYFRLNQWQKQEGKKVDTTAFIDFTNIEELGKDGKAPRLLNPIDDFEPLPNNSCKPGYRFDAPQFKCLPYESQYPYLVWNDQAQRWDPQLVLTNGADCLAPATYFNAGSLTTAGAAIYGAKTIGIKNPLSLAVIGASTYLTYSGTMTIAGSCISPIGSAILGGGAAVANGLAAIGGLTILAPALIGGGLYLAGRYITNKMKRNQNIKTSENHLATIVQKINQSWDTMLTVELGNSLLVRVNKLLNEINSIDKALIWAKGEVSNSKLIVEIDTLLKEGKEIPDNLKEEFIQEGIIQPIIDSWYTDMKISLKQFAKGRHREENPEIILADLLIDKLRYNREIFTALQVVNNLVPSFNTNSERKNKPFEPLPQNLKDFFSGKLNTVASLQAISGNTMVTNSIVNSTESHVKELENALVQTKRERNAALSQTAQVQGERNAALAESAQAKRERNTLQTQTVQANPTLPQTNTIGAQIGNRETRRNKSGGKRKVNRKTRRSEKY